MCYEMICSSSNKTLTVKIKDQYIVCPREGGKVEVNGDYQGFIYCPDYNLICTGTVMCNDMFDCLDKKSETKFYRLLTRNIELNHLIYQGLINKEPDVDSIYRQTRTTKNYQTNQFFFFSGELMYLPGNFIPINST